MLQHPCLLGFDVLPTRHSQVPALDVSVDNLKCFIKRGYATNIQSQVLLQWTHSLLHSQRGKRSLSNALPIVFSCRFFRIMNSLRSLSKWSSFKRKPMISSKGFVALALSGSENYLRQISNPFSVSSLRTVARAAPSEICAST